MKAMRPNRRVGNPGPARDYHPITNGAQLRWADSMVRKILANRRNLTPAEFNRVLHEGINAFPEKRLYFNPPAPSTSAQLARPSSARQQSLYGLLPAPQQQPQEPHQPRRRAR